MAKATTMNDNVPVLIHNRTQRNGDQVAQTHLTEAADQREKVVLAKPCVIPVLFIPGIMGTNLRNSQSKKKAWRPPNLDVRGSLDLIGQLFSYAFKSTEERTADLRTPEVEVDTSGSIHVGNSGLPENVLVARGWGALMRSSYHPFMGELQDKLNKLSEFNFKECKTEFKSWAAEHGLDAPTEWGASQGEALTEGEILHAANYQFDVWAGGYNWLRSNAESGKAIQDLIDTVILPFYNEGKKVTVKDTPDGQGNSACSIQRKRPSRPIAQKVIVVTHSMGGLVSRALTEIHHCDRVMGVSHGVMPATGAPATYKRMRSGFEGSAQIFLGRNAADVVGILSQAPGGLELLPTADYNDGKPWLKVRDKSGAEILALPKKGDPYGEIYTSPAWYGMVPEANGGLMGVGQKDGASETVPRQGGEESQRITLSKVLDSVQRFHAAIQGGYKNPTYVHYGAQGLRDTKHGHGGILKTGLLAADDRHAWGEVAWEGIGIAGLDPYAIKVSGDDANGTLTLSTGQSLRIAPPDCPGDGTVPVFSGEAPAKAGIDKGVVMTFAHGQGKPGPRNAHFGYDHQESYGDEQQRSLFATMYAIVKIAQQAQWHKQ